MSKKNQFSTLVKKQTLAEQVSATIRDAILAKEWQPGEALPTEPELAAQFGVSRAVVRDATRMLAANGLVEARHGKGVFVTESQVDAFGEALFVALYRSGTTVWDVEEFEQSVFPEICVLAARRATDDEIAALEIKTASYVTAAQNMDAAQIRDLFLGCLEAIMSATHNRVWQLLARPLLNLHSVRSWEQIEGVDDTDGTAVDQAFLQALVSLIATRDENQVRAGVGQLMQLPPQAETAMRATAVGETPIIPF